MSPLRRLAQHLLKRLLSRNVVPSTLSAGKVSQTKTLTVQKHQSHQPGARPLLTTLQEQVFQKTLLKWHGTRLEDLQVT